MKSIIIANDGKTTSTYFYSKSVVKELNRINNPCLVLGKLTGKTRQEKKSDLEEKARFYQLIDIGGLSWGEVSEIENYFRTYGKRYGLIKEFKENGII